MVERTDHQLVGNRTSERARAIAAALAGVAERIDARRQPDQDVQIVAVTKRFPAEVAAAAVAAGCRDLGENYGQELLAKADAVDDLLTGSGIDPPRWHMIGPVQRNKVKKLVGRVRLWHTVDRVSLAGELARREPGAPVLVQVNTTGEASKSGVDPADLGGLVHAAGELGLEVRGLMTMGPTDPSLDPRPAFALCRRLADELGLDDCSMGMSGDFEVAVDEGATIVRIGSLIFGPRPD